MKSDNQAWIQRMISFCFGISGAAALIYQVVWQRALFRIYGIDTASVAVIVAAFMLGLGIGSLVGGWISEKYPDERSVWFFGVFEATIGIFGMFSLPLFDWIGLLTNRVDVTGTAVASFSLILVPTVLMGATLPLLVGYWIPKLKNVGAVVGQLYYANTLGAACGAVACVSFLFKCLGLSKTILLSAVLNFSCAFLMLYAAAHFKSKPESK